MLQLSGFRGDLAIMAAFPAYFTDNLWFIILVGSALTFPLAWIADGVFKENAFGVMGNYILLMIGAYGGAAWLMLFIGSATRTMALPHLPFFAAAGGAAAVILSACFVKRLVVR